MPTFHCFLVPENTWTIPAGANSGQGSLFGSVDPRPLHATRQGV